MSTKHPPHADAYPCILCPAHFENKPAQADHLSSSHSLTEPWLCHECLFSAATSELLTAHARSAHHRPGQKSMHRCTVIGCPGASLASEDMRMRHTKQDHTEQTLNPVRKCTRGRCKFNNESYVGMSVHVLHVHAPICEACGKKFGDIFLKIDHDKGRGKDGGCMAKEDASTPGEQKRPADNTKSLDHNSQNGAGEGVGTTIQSTTQNASSQPQQQPAENQPRPLQLPPSSSAKEKLPKYLEDLGFEPDDFNPSIPWVNTVANKHNYHDLPEILPEYLFRGNPKNIAYGNILRLATRFTNIEIYNKSNEGRPAKIFNSPGAVDGRVRHALHWAAVEWGMKRGVDQVAEWLNGEREKNGLKPRGKKRAREDNVVDAGSTLAPDDAGPMGAPNKRARTAYDSVAPSFNPGMPPFAPHPNGQASTYAAQNGWNAAYSQAYPAQPVVQHQGMYAPSNTMNSGTSYGAHYPNQPFIQHGYEPAGMQYPTNNMQMPSPYYNPYMNGTPAMAPFAVGGLPTPPNSSASSNGQAQQGTTHGQALIAPALQPQEQQSQQQQTPVATPQSDASSPRTMEKPDPHGLRGKIHYRHFKVPPNGNAPRGRATASDVIDLTQDD